MKKLDLVGLKPCPHCRWAVAYLMTEDGEHTFGITLDATTAQELSHKEQNPVHERFLTELLLHLLASSSYVPRQIVLDWNQAGFLTARIDLSREIFACSPEEAIVLAAEAKIPLYATDRIFECIHRLHPPDKESKAGPLQLKPKPTLH